MSKKVMQSLRDNMLSILAIFFLGLLLLLVILFFNRPQPTAPEVEPDRETVTQPPSTPTADPAISATSTAVAATAVSQFLNETTAAELLDSLPDYAADFDVELVDLSAQPRNPTSADSWFNTRTFQLLARGERVGLLDFVGHIRASTPAGVRIENLQLTESDSTDLSLQLIIHTAPEGGGRLITPTPLPSPTPQPTDTPSPTPEPTTAP